MGESTAFMTFFQSVHHRLIHYISFYRRLNVSPCQIYSLQFVEAVDNAVSDRDIFYIFPILPQDYFFFNWKVFFNLKFHNFELFSL